MKHIPLPNVNPDTVSALSLVVSVIFLLNGNCIYRIVVLGIVWFLDIIDGTIAQRYQWRKNDEEKHKGWVTDVTIDRLSEGVISVAYFMPLFPLFVLNTALTLWSYKHRRHIILPLRQCLFGYLIIKYIFFS